jgi:hypothetical protein
MPISIGVRHTFAMTVSALAAALLLGTLAPTSAANVNIGVSIGSAPPPPVFVFEDEPEVILVPRSRVYYVGHSDFDLFRYGRYWYINRGGWWYRARSYSGPFAYLEYAKIPVEIVRVPGKYHRHPLGGPPGQTGIHPNKGVAKTGYKASVDRKDWDPPKQNKSKGKKK